MPTKKPRVCVTLNPNTHHVLERFAQLQNRTRSAVIGELLDSVTPALSKTIALLDAASSAPEDLKRGLIGVVEDAHNDLLEVAGSTSKNVDLVLDDLAKNIDPSAEANPRIVTRGSGQEESKTKSWVMPQKKSLKSRT